jgi:CheY-like chemotaxis protein
VIVAFMRSYNLQPVYYNAVGCQECDWSGYKGRLSLIEFLEINQHLRDQITSGQDEGVLRDVATKSGCLISLTQDALWHLANGDTTLDEVAPYIDLDKQTFRLSQEALDQRPPVEIVRPMSGTNSPRKVLLAIRNPLERVALRAAIEAEGIQVAEAEDGETATARIETERLNLVLVDLDLPKKNGFAIARHLRASERFSAFPIIITSDKRDEDAEVDAIQAGADDYVVKGASLRLTMTRLKALLRRTNYSSPV